MDARRGNKVIITVAVTGAVGEKAKHPNLPVTPKEIADSALEAHSAGASIAHIHVRNPATGEGSMEFDLYREVFERIRERSDMIINLTTGSGGKVFANQADPLGLGAETMWRSPERRTEHVVKLKPELCSLDVGTMNMAERIFANIVPHVQEMARRIGEAGVKPELEVFDMGHIGIAKNLLEKGLIQSPPMFQLCLGIPWGMAATAKNMLFMKESLPPDSLWGGMGVGPFSFPMAAQSILLGGNVRVGFEDNFNLKQGVPAKSNAQLVEKAVNIVRTLDREPASSSEARKILGLEFPPSSPR
jgi:uncharacterized protein (DUF849 family)